MSESASVSTIASGSILFVVVALLVTLTTILSVSANNDPLQGVSIRYYEIQGNTFKELRSQMRELGPRDFEGASCYAFTKWEIDWRWPQEEDGVPQVSQTEVELSLNVTLPRWKEYLNASPALQRRWDHFYKALVEHEDGHVRLARKAADRLKHRLRNSGAKTARQAHKLARAVLSGLLWADGRYDERSLGGLSQGVLLRK